MGTGGNINRLSRIDGGSGIDTLQLQNAANLDLTAIKNAGGATPDGHSRIESIEIIDMATDAAANTLNLNLTDLLDMSGMNVFNTLKGWSNVGASTAFADTLSRHQLIIKGGVNDQVQVENWALSWTSAGQVSDGTNIYSVYNHNNTYAQLIVSPSLTIIG